VIFTLGENEIRRHYSFKKILATEDNISLICDNSVITQNL